MLVPFLVIDTNFSVSGMVPEVITVIGKRATIFQGGICNV